MTLLAFHKPLHWLYWFLAVFVAQTAGSFLVTSPATGFSRAAAFFVVIPLITTLLCATDRFRSRYSILIVAAATVASFTTIHLLRNNLSATWFFGPCPPEMEFPGYAILAVITIASAGCAGAAFASAGRFRRLRWVVVGAIAVLLVGAAVFAKSFLRDLSPSYLLQSIARIEQQENPDPGTMQQLSTMLAMCGRETDAESVSRWIVTGGGPVSQRSTLPSIDISKFHPMPWRKTFTDIANRERLIIIMEAHNAPKHRQWIEQTLPILRNAGFHDYAAETLSESGRNLKQRGYPLRSTGYYVSDPHFGNVLRTAIDLDFDLHTYEAYEKTIDRREYGEAADLAKLFSANPNLKLVVHAGYGHVYKTTPAHSAKPMAAHLWEMTGIEPYCILQMYHSPEDAEARQLARLLDADSEPTMLVPAPVGLRDRQFQYPPGSVDALVIHPPSVGGPEQRVHSFKKARQKMAGVWNGSKWPVLIGAFKKGESADAIALDQVMLRERERDFVLWVPSDDFEIRIFSTKGQLNSTNADGSPAVRMKHELIRGNSG